jgi:DNA-binding MltR family transcriptional regulator
MAKSRQVLWEHAIAELQRETDRGIAIVGATFLDDILKTCIDVSLRKPTPEDDQMRQQFFMGDGPLAAFSARIRMAYLLEIIGPLTFHDLKIINDIRNTFAHYTSEEDAARQNHLVSFSLQRITDQTRSFKSLAPKEMLDDVKKRVREAMDRRDLPSGKTRTEGQDNYVMAVLTIGHRLLLDHYANAVANKKPRKVP